MINKIQALEQLRRAIQMVVASVSEKEAMEIATVYPKYETGKSYKQGDYFTYGVNNVGDPQLYKVVQAHTSSAEWIPSSTTSLYVAVGLSQNGYVEWSQPAGAHDAYAIGDIVMYQGKLYISMVNSNIYAPGVVAGQWELYEG